MEHLKRFYNGRIALVHLDTSSVELLPLSEGIIAENIGGAAVNSALLEEYKDYEPLVFGTGPLTGSFAPASCLMVATFRSLMGDVHHVPFMLKAGPQLKFSGIDFMVITGRAEQPCIIELLNGTIRVLPGDIITGLEIPEAERILMASGTSSPETALITGPAAEHGSPYACVSMGLWGSLDKVSLAGFMASKGLRAVTMNASGGIAFPQENILINQEMVKTIRDGYQRKKFPVAIYEMIDGAEDAKQLIKRFHKKSHACYHCPFPCMSYLEYKWVDPKQDGRRKKKDGFYFSDHEGFLAMAPKKSVDALILMKRCIDIGLDPCAVANRLDQNMSLMEALDLIANIAASSKESEDAMAIESYSKGPVSSEIHGLFGGGIPRILPDAATDSFETWGKRVAVSMILGICPILMLLFPNISVVDLLKLITVQNGDLKSLQDVISSRIQSILTT